MVSKYRSSVTRRHMGVGAAPRLTCDATVVMLYLLRERYVITTYRLMSTHMCVDECLWRASSSKFISNTVLQHSFGSACPCSIINTVPVLLGHFFKPSCVHAPLHGLNLKRELFRLLNANLYVSFFKQLPCYFIAQTVALSQIRVQSLSRQRRLYSKRVPCSARMHEWWSSP